MRSPSLIALVLLAGSLLPAQTDLRQRDKLARGLVREPAVAPIALDVDVWNEQQSRQLFAACDQDADDGIDLIEFAAALGLLMEPSTLARFRRIDADRNGYLDWSEFDRYCGGVVYDGHTLRLSLCRPLQEDDKKVQPAAPATPAQLLLQLFDADRSGDLSPAEFEVMLARANLPVLLANNFSKLDADGSKTLSSKELAPMLNMPNLAKLQAKAAALPLLPPPYAAWDLDANGSLEPRELAEALRHIDPDLARFAPQVLDRLDRDGDHKVGAAELEARTPATSRAVVERSKLR